MSRTRDDLARREELAAVVARLAHLHLRAQAGLWVLIPDAGSRPLRQGQEESSRRVAKRDKAMVQIEALRLFILSIDDKRVNGNLGPARTLYCIPQ